jgi:shikimate kinase
LREGKGKRNIILVGFMGTGKTVVGEALARRLGWRFVDMDEEIIRETGLTIPKIFDNRGEPFFRSLEKKALRDYCRGREQVIAAGGGAICDPDNLAMMREAADVVCLTAPEAVLAERLQGDRSRPLLSGPDREKAIAELLEARAVHYRKADLTVDTSGATPDEVAWEILNHLFRDSSAAGGEDLED